MQDVPRGTPRLKTRTLILDQGRPLARLDAAVWPTVGTMIDLADGRLGRVRTVRLRLAPSTALILIDIESGPS